MLEYLVDLSNLVNNNNHKINNVFHLFDLRDAFLAQKLLYFIYSWCRESSLMEGQFGKFCAEINKE